MGRENRVKIRTHWELVGDQRKFTVIGNAAMGLRNRLRMWVWTQK